MSRDWLTVVTRVRRPAFRRMALVACVAAQSGCFLPTPEVTEVSLVIFDQRRDAGDPAVTRLSFSVINRGDDPIEVARCGEVISTDIERAVNTLWEEESVAVCPADQPTVPLVLGPAEQATSERLVTGTGSGDFRLRLSVTVRGSNRLVFSGPFSIQ